MRKTDQTAALSQQLLTGKERKSISRDESPSSKSRPRSFKGPAMWIFILLFWVGQTFAQVPFLGGCPDIETMPDFNVTRYTGKWYEAERYLAVFELGGKCVTAEYTALPNNSIQIVNTKISVLTGESSSIVGIGTIKDPEVGTSKLSVVFPALPLQFEAPYWILSTDYDNYAVVYSCADFGIFNTKNVWILLRTPTAPVEILEKAYATIDQNHLSRAFLYRTNQKDCPNPEPSTPSKK